MAQANRMRVREREPGPRDTYEESVRYLLELRERAFKGQVVIKGREQAWEQSRQGRLRYYICRETNTPAAVLNWNVFIHDIHTHSGKHRHQGGLVIYVLEGEGYTEVNGERIEWEAGDLLLLPIVPGGVEHKHFNRKPGQNAKWIAFIYRPYGDETGSYLEQKEVSPDFRG
ncbi:MAG TPA: cupin domain-containing protein [Chloroflexota bacterium]|jgi:quercetin dioxygenase-like cupin family protein